MLRAILTILAVALVAALCFVVYEAYVRSDAASAVRTAIDDHLAGKKPRNLTFWTEDLGVSEPIDLDDFTADLRAGYDLAPGEKWLNRYNVEIRTKNGRRYVASPIWSNYHLGEDQSYSEWSIACCIQLK